MDWFKLVGIIISGLVFIGGIIFKFYSLHRDVKENTKDIEELKKNSSGIYELMNEVKLLNQRVSIFLDQNKETLATNNKRIEKMEMAIEVLNKTTQRHDKCLLHDNQKGILQLLKD